MVEFEVQTRISRKFGLILRQAILGALYARFNKLEKDVMRHNNRAITDINNMIYEYLNKHQIVDPIKIYAKIEVDNKGYIKKIEITKIEVFKKEKELNPNISISFE